MKTWIVFTMLLVSAGFGASATTAIVTDDLDVTDVTPRSMTATDLLLELVGPAPLSSQALASTPAFPSTGTGFIICEIRTCKCFDCQLGGPCVPVPPQAWCTPL